MPVPEKLKSRCEIREILGYGGMRVVYRAFGNAARSNGALKDADSARIIPSGAARAQTRAHLRGLVDPIAEKARRHQQHGRFTGTLAQRKILKTISSIPGTGV